MNLGKVFKFIGQTTVETGSDEFRANKRNSFLSEATKFVRRTDGHSGPEAWALALVWNVFSTTGEGIASPVALKAGLHR